MADVLTGKGYVATTSQAAGLTAGGSETITLIGCAVANVNESSAYWITAIINRDGGVDTELCHKISIPVSDSLDLLQGKVVLNSGDSIDFIGEAGAALEINLSYLVQT